MHFQVNNRCDPFPGLGRALAFLAVLLIAGPAVGAPPEFADDHHRWLPSLSFGTDLVGFSAGGSAEGSLRDEDPQGDDLVLNPYFLLSAEIMTPGLEAIPGAPRLFLHGDVSWTWPIGRDIAKEGDPGDMGSTFKTPGTPAEAVEGQGSSTATQLEPWQFGAGAGLSFTFRVKERRFRIKPSVEWMREELTVTGQINAPILTGSGTFDPFVPASFFFFEFRDQTTEVFHALGGGLQLEMDAGRWGPMIFNFYAQARAYKVLSDTTVKLRDTITVFATDTADWEFEHDDIIYRGGLGIRFRYSPE